MERRMVAAVSRIVVSKVKRFLKRNFSDKLVIWHIPPSFTFFLPLPLQKSKGRKAFPYFYLLSIQFMMRIGINARITGANIGIF